MKNKSKLHCALVLLTLWAVSCQAAFLCYDRFDGALGDMRWFLCIYSPVLIIKAFLRGEQPEVQQTPHWAQALIFFLCTALVYILFLWGVNPLYLFWTWLIVLMLVFAIVASRLHLHPPKGCADICGGILFHGCYLLTLIAFLLIFRPLTVNQICALADGQDSEFLYWESCYTREAPLGAYVFADEDRQNYYYYNVVGGELFQAQTLDERLDGLFHDTHLS